MKIYQRRCWTLRCLFLLFVLSWGLGTVLWGQGSKLRIIQVGCLDLQAVFNMVQEDKLLNFILERGVTKDLLDARKLDVRISELKTLLETNRAVLELERIVSLENELAYHQNQLELLLAAAAAESVQQHATDTKLARPVLKELYRVVRQVAQREGYSLVLEKGVAVIYAEDSLDITPLVLAELQALKTVTD